MKKQTTTIRLASPQTRRTRTRGKWVISADEAFVKLSHKVGDLAAVVALSGRPEVAPLVDVVAGVREALVRVAPEEAAAQGLALAKVIFQQRRMPGAVSEAARGVGNAARQLKQMVAREVGLPVRELRYAA